MPEDALKRPPLWNRSASIDPSWLRLMPSSGAIAVVSLAFEPSPAYWDSAFALADRLEKTDPARGAGTGAHAAEFAHKCFGARLEADLWPHLKGLTAGVFGEPSGAQGPLGGLLALHLDSDLAALRLVSQTLPRLRSSCLPARIGTLPTGNPATTCWSPGANAYWPPPGPPLPIPGSRWRRCRQPGLRPESLAGASGCFLAGPMLQSRLQTQREKRG